MPIPEISSYLPPFANQSRPAVTNPVFQAPAVQPMNPAMLQHREVEYVDGQNGASSVMMGPNSSALYLDKSQNVLWVVATDQNGSKSLVKGYHIGDEYVPPKPVTLDDLMAQMQSMNERLNKMEEGNRNGQPYSKPAGKGKPNGADASAGNWSRPGNAEWKPDGGFNGTEQPSSAGSY